MATHSIAAANFKAQCLALLDQVNESGESLAITKRGKVVAVLTPPPQPAVSLIGSLATPGYRFDDAFSPAVDPSDWDANR